MQKLYCYVDETGQDTKGEFFIVSVVVTAEEHEQLLEILGKIEKMSGKGKVKWHQTRDRAKLLYMRELLNHPLFRNKFYFSTYHKTKDYLPLTVITVARTITAVMRGMDILYNFRNLKTPMVRGSNLSPKSGAPTNTGSIRLLFDYMIADKYNLSRVCEI